MKEGLLYTPFEDCLEKIDCPCKIPSKSYLTEGLYPIVSQEDCLISGYSNDAKALIKLKRPIIVFGDHTRVVKYIDFDFIVGADGVKLLLPSLKFNPRYFYYAIKNININSLGYARHYKILKQALILTPSLTEQERIVGILDSEFERIEAIKANAQQALQSAKDLFQAELRQALTPKDGWKIKKVGDMCELLRGKRFVRADIVESGVPCIHYGDIYTHYGLSATKTKGCLKPELAKKMRFANKNDVVVVQAGENNMDIGVGVAWLGEEPVAVHDACFIMKHQQNPMYISYYLRSPQYHNYLKDEVNEGKICSFLRPALENAVIPLPPLSEQEAIVSRLDAVSATCKEIERNSQEIITQCEALKQSLLRKAFEGEL